MKRYCHVATEVEAVQLRADNIEQVAAWCTGTIKGIALPREQWVIDIQTREGEMRAEQGDWVVRGVKGEFYPCKDEIFGECYYLDTEEPWELPPVFPGTELKLNQPLEFAPAAPSFTEFVTTLMKQLDLSRPDAAEREALGRAVRQTWVNWAREQKDPKASWLQPWEELSEPMREVDRRIGVAIAHVIMSTAQQVVRQQAERYVRRVASWTKRQPRSKG